MLTLALVGCQSAVNHTATDGASCVGGRGKPIDLMFVQDTTGSMGPTIRNVALHLPEIVDQVSALTRDARFGVAEFRDYGGGGDFPYRLASSLSADPQKTKHAIEALVADGGGDTPESDLEALDQLTADGAIGWKAPDAAVRIAILVTDAPFKNEISLLGHDRAQVFQRLVDAKIKVIGLSIADYGGPSYQDLSETAATTGAVAAQDLDFNGDGMISTYEGEIAAGAPLVFKFSDSGDPIGATARTIADQIVAGVKAVACGD